MKHFVLSIWANVIASAVTAGCIYIVTASTLLKGNSWAVGLATLVGLLVLTIIALLQRRTRGRRDRSSTEGKALSISVNDSATVGTIVQANNIVGLTMNAAVSNPEPEQVSFIVEGVRPIFSGFQILFSIWNMTKHPIKIFEFVSEEYERIKSVDYYGGPRSKLQLCEDEKSTLWSGRTDEIPSKESSSFDLRYIIKTGPADGDPWVILGISARYHNYQGSINIISSDAVFLYRSGDCFIVRPQELDSLRDLSCRVYTEGTVQEWADKIHDMFVNALDKHLRQSNRSD